MTELTPTDLGFDAIEEAGGEAIAWRKAIGRLGKTLRFRRLRTLAELKPAEDLQRSAFGSDDLDILPANELVVVAETGGDVLGAISEGETVAVAIGWGGDVDRRPRLVSDLLAVRAELRSLGLGAELKRLQAATALAKGFEEMVWTVDPLRAANARLNFEKLGAICDRYEEDRYGRYAAALYGEMPTDRLQMRWHLTSHAVRDKLLGQARTRTAADVLGVPRFDRLDPTTSGTRALVPAPRDIDGLLARDPAEALRWRLRLREQLQAALAAGFTLTGFITGIDADEGLSAYLVERLDQDVDGHG